jgi:hypothetical protein
MENLHASVLSRIVGELPSVSDRVRLALSSKTLLNTCYPSRCDRLQHQLCRAIVGAVLRDAVEVYVWSRNRDRMNLRVVQGRNGSAGERRACVRMSFVDDINIISTGVALLRVVHRWFGHEALRVDVCKDGYKTVAFGEGLKATRRHLQALAESLRNASRGGT